MAQYLVRAKPKPALLSNLRKLLDSGEVRMMQPFGRALDSSLRKAKLDSDGLAVWEEENYCNPPLAQERAAVLDRHFEELSVERVSEGEGWKKISQLPSL